MLNFDELTLGEIEEIEMLTGGSIESVYADGKPKGRAMRVIYWITKRKQDPKLKFEDTEKVTMQEALKVLSGDDSKKE
jgi:hypothetical protein